MSDFAKKLSDLIAKLVNTPEHEAQLLERLQKNLKDPALQLTALIKYNHQAEKDDKSDLSYPISILEAAWAIHAIIRICPIKDMQIFLRDYFIDVIMKTDAGDAIFPAIEKDKSND